MDSLLASYASSDDEETSSNQQSHTQINQPKNQEKYFHDFRTNPLPKSSKFSLPPPKSSSSIFSSLPRAKTHVADPQHFPKKVVQFRPPVNLVSSNVGDEEEEEDEEEKERKSKKAESDGVTPSVKSFLSSIPAPRNSVALGVLGSGLGTGRRSVIDADVRDTSLGSGDNESEVGVSGMGDESGPVEYVASGDYSSWGSGNENCVNVEGYSGYGGGGDSNVENSGLNAASGDYVSSGCGYGNYASYGQYANVWNEGSSMAAVEEVPIERALRLPMKRGRKDDPPQIIEVNQDELMKKRPREDQAKLTGIAFGPAYQPASSKGKPTKLQKRKHQIGALYFDMKQKETELAERRSQGFLTKAQTQGKYGW